MDVYEPLSEFFEAIRQDGRIGVTHISLYLALLYKWNLEGGSNPIVINREEIMKWAKVQARHTYNRCIHELSEYGYIKYYPSSNPNQGSQVYMRLL